MQNNPSSSAAYHVGMLEKGALVSTREPYQLLGEEDRRELLRREPAEAGRLRGITSTGSPVAASRLWQWQSD